MSQQTQHAAPQAEPLPEYRAILLAVDSSDHSNRGITEAVGLAAHYNGEVTATHVYAAKLHDLRFRQMEGGLPEQFRQEQELERQRDVHDDLISRGLSIITDSYLDQVAQEAEKKDVPLHRRSLEGKNYRALVNEANSGRYDLLVLGALGLGAIRGSRVGSVCQRVSRRSEIDTLVIKQPTRSIGEGPIVVAVDGSTKAYGGLLTALSLARAWDVPVKVVSAFDPYYHYVAFNRIAGVLSDEAGKVFKFKEQEKLHEEIIDSGLAKIYQGHLAVAQSIAADYGVEVETVLLDGKPHDVIARYLREVTPSLLVLGTTGIHADAELDIGSNAELLLQEADCALLLSQRQHQPAVDRLASATTSWSREAEARMQRVPSFVRPMAKMAILRYAQEHGHTVITESIVDEATAQLMPGHAEQAMQEIVEAHDKGELKQHPAAEEAMRWSDQATRLLLNVKDLSLRGNLSMRAEKRARRDGSRTVQAAHIQPFLDDQVPLREYNPGAATAGLAGSPTASTSDNGPAEEASNDSLHWQAAALARLMRVPEGFMRDSSKQRIEEYARIQGHEEITLAVAEAGLAEARKSMERMMQQGGMPRPGTAGNPAGGTQQPTPAPEHPTGPATAAWSPEAESLLQEVPAGFCRDMTRKAAEGIAAQKAIDHIDGRFMKEVIATFKSGSEQAGEGMLWDTDAQEQIARAPDAVRGMLIQEIEGWAKRNGMDRVSGEAVDAVKGIWSERGVFHLDPDDRRNG